MKDLTKVIRRPLITERSADLREAHNQYVFEVDPAANKHEIVRALDVLFGVKPVKVQTLNVRGKIKRMGRYAGKRPDWKKAIVTLAEGDSIDLFDVV